MREKTPKSLRLRIGLFGRTNVGKSSFLNYLASQDVAITSPVPGTTTDVVEKAMELLPVGPVVFLDTAGLDDTSVLSPLRLAKTRKIFGAADAAVLITEPGRWTDFEERIMTEADQKKIPLMIVINKRDLGVSDSFVAEIRKKCGHVILCSCRDQESRDETIDLFKKSLIDLAPENFLRMPALIGDLLPPGGMAVLIVPIDLQAPKGRLILPQVQAIRDALDNDASVCVVKEREYASILKRLNVSPDLVVCDSQVVLKMTADTPQDVRCTTFSILFSRWKGDLAQAVKSIRTVDDLKDGDRVLIAEACSHHAIEDDIGRVKIPRWLKQYTGANLKIDVTCGKDFPEDLASYRLVIHCGACMLTRREMLARVEMARQAGVSLTNYGVCIAFLQGVLERVLSPFPSLQDLLSQKAGLSS